jgi:hypothetical protein
MKTIRYMILVALFIFSSECTAAGPGADPDSGQTPGTSVSHDVAPADLDDDDLDTSIANDGNPNKMRLNNPGISLESGQTLDSSSSNERAIYDFEDGEGLDAYLHCQ